ncbi:hypothetical protein DPMN_035946 [Dreissena polymorpha]|uniref:Uncharacterized protein n=1 Tax=Dreissena polymorpha TaxID=45954 RepID=A0A9D4MBN3_DREPO|nr:hypothetical protein DPMN_035946 [Dreissena polymorpha]
MFTIADSTIRLVNGSSERSGRDLVWRRQMWYAERLEYVFDDSPFEHGVHGYLINNVSCESSEHDLGECKSYPWNETECDNGNVRAQASNVTTTKNSSLQLTCGGAEDDVSECGRIFSRFHACRLEMTKEM